MANEKTYKCVTCFKITGEPVKDKPKEETWYWNLDPYFSGPFCCSSCGHKFAQHDTANQVYRLFQDSRIVERILQMKREYAAQDHPGGMLQMRWSKNTVIAYDDKVHASDLGPLPNIATDVDACNRLDLVVGVEAQGEMGD